MKLVTVFNLNDFSSVTSTDISKTPRPTLAGAVEILSIFFFQKVKEDVKQQGLGISLVVSNNLTGTA